MAPRRLVAALLALGVCGREDRWAGKQMSATKPKKTGNAGKQFDAERASKAGPKAPGAISRGWPKDEPIARLLAAVQAWPT
jgi:hypothetical protein